MEEQPGSDVSETRFSFRSRSWWQPHGAANNRSRYATNHSQLVKFQSDSQAQVQVNMCLIIAAEVHQRQLVVKSSCEVRDTDPPAPTKTHVREDERMSMRLGIQGRSLPGAITLTCQCCPSVVTDLWSCCLPGPSGPTDGYMPCRDQRTCDARSSHSKKGFFLFFSPNNSHAAAGLEQTECKRKKYPAKSSFLSGKGNSDLYAF